MPKPPILLTEEIVPPPALIRGGVEALPAIIRARGERAKPPLHRILYCHHPQTLGWRTRAAKQVCRLIERARNVRPFTSFLMLSNLLFECLLYTFGSSFNVHSQDGLSSLSMQSRLRLNPMIGSLSITSVAVERLCHLFTSSSSAAWSACISLDSN
jgi:hypothetical protein